MAHVRSIDGETESILAATWTCASVPAGSVDHPSELAAAGANWVPAEVPGTAAGALARAGAWSLDTPRDFDEDDWWFRGVLEPGGALDDDLATVLRFGGLATLADAWLDDEHLLQSESMFLEEEVPVTRTMQKGKELVLRFSSLKKELAKKRPRPKWRTAVVAQQQLRWFRTTLLGRIPSWSPPVAPVGPWRPITVRHASRVADVSADVQTRVVGTDGLGDVTLIIAPATGIAILGASIHVGEARAELTCELTSDGLVFARGAVTVPGVSLWWPFTHGAPTLYGVHAIVRTERGDVKVDLGRTGFRTLTLDREPPAFTLRVNGVEVFCRGAAWMPLDPVGLKADEAALRAALEQARRAGMNMLRLSGTMVYEAQAFHDLCDELGILVWQDFMFANMDVPDGDEAFAGQARAEARDLTTRLQLSPSLAILCGNSEASQQAAMLGLPPRDWASSLFTTTLRKAALAHVPDVPYVQSTPEGGALPFRADSGVSHYYGVGAYLRPLDDARRARVRFTSECLAFANVPCDETLESFLRDGEVPPNHPRWKARVPRDKGPAWDFDDVRDHYLARLFAVDPAALKYADLPRYLELSRVVTGEVMLAALAEWRREGSECKGALVWTYRDLWAGAGWGVTDALGRPKAAYHYLKRAFAPVALFATDEGVNGLRLHAVNDGPAPIDAEVRLVLYRAGEVPVAEGKARVEIPAHGVTALEADTLLGRFVDTTYAYRFGPPGHDVAVATLSRASGERLGQAFYFPGGLPSQRVADVGLEALVEPAGQGRWRVTLRTKKLAQSIAFDARGFAPDDEFFHLAPGDERTVTFEGAGEAFSGRVQALNATASTKIVVRAAP